jgi:hypothetical protein
MDFARMVMFIICKLKKDFTCLDICETLRLPRGGFMKKGDIAFAEYRNSIVEILDINGDEVTIIVETLADLYYSVIVPKSALKKIGVL